MVGQIAVTTLPLPLASAVIRHRARPYPQTSSASAERSSCAGPSPAPEKSVAFITAMMRPSQSETSFSNCVSASAPANLPFPGLLLSGWHQTCSIVCRRPTSELCAARSTRWLRWTQQRSRPFCRHAQLQICRAANTTANVTFDHFCNACL